MCKRVSGWMEGGGGGKGCVDALTGRPEGMVHMMRIRWQRTWQPGWPTCTDTAWCIWM